MPSVHFSSSKTEYQTPPDLFDQLWDEFGPFDLDPCCRPGHYTAKRVYQHGGQIYVPDSSAWEWGKHTIDGLGSSGVERPWHGRVYLNPPFGREIGKWVEKAVHEVECGNAELVVALLPARTDTKWWQSHIMHELWWKKPTFAADIHPHIEVVRFLPGRLKFGGAKNSAPFPSAIIVWRR